MLDNCIKSII